LIPDPCLLDLRTINLAEDPTQTNDLSAKEPERLRIIQELRIMEAARNNVFPLNNSQLPVFTAERPGS
jgi:hypothetical protein